jgi:hypothetical protein
LGLVAPNLLSVRPHDEEMVHPVIDGYKTQKGEGLAFTSIVLWPVWPPRTIKCNNNNN